MYLLVFLKSKRSYCFLKVIMFARGINFTIHPAPVYIVSTNLSNIRLYVRIMNDCTLFLSLYCKYIIYEKLFDKSHLLFCYPKVTQIFDIVNYALDSETLLDRDKNKVFQCFNSFVFENLYKIIKYILIKLGDLCNFPLK